PLKADLKAFLKKNPGSYVLRRYRAGDGPVFVQGEAGWTAFYILTTEDVLTLRKGQLAEEKRPAVQAELRKDIAELEARLRAMGPLDANHRDRAVAEVKVAVRKKDRSARTMLANWLGAAGRPALGQRIVDDAGNS